MEKIENAFKAISVNLDRFGGLIVLPAVSIVVIVDVFMRYVFNSPFIWSLEFNEWMLLLIFAFAIPECTRQNGHIRMELVVSNLPRRLQETFDIVYVVSALALFFLLARNAWEEFIFDYELERVTEFLLLPIWGHQLAIFAMCVILIIYFTLRLIATVLSMEQFSRTESVGLEE